MQICGDPTCTSRGCSSEAIDEWERAGEALARSIVRDMLGLPPEPGSIEAER